MSSATPATIGRDELAQAADFMRAGEWILRVLDPRRPPRREITEWAASIRAAADIVDPEVAARMVRPGSALARRLAEHVATLMSAGDAAHRLAGQAQIHPGVPLREAVLSFVYAAGVLPANTHVHTVMTAMRPRLAAGAGLIKAYEELRTAFSECATDTDAADTERSILAERVRAYRMVRESSTLDKGWMHAPASGAAAQADAVSP